MHFIRKVVSFTEYVISHWISNRNTRVAASIAFYAIFSIAPILVIGIFLTGLFVGETVAEYEFLIQIKALIGEQGAKSVERIFKNSLDITHGIFASTVSFVILFYSATKVFSEMRYELNGIFEISITGRKEKFKHFLVTRILGLVLVLCLGFFLLASLLLSTLLGVFSHWIVEYSSFDLNSLGVVNFFFTVIFIGVLFGLVLKYFPSKPIKWKQVWLGTLISAIVFYLGKEVITLYLLNSTIVSLYGATGSIFILLVWIYFSVQTLFLGAEICNAQMKFSNRTGFEFN